MGCNTRRGKGTAYGDAADVDVVIVIIVVIVVNAVVKEWTVDDMAIVVVDDVDWVVEKSIDVVVIGIAVVDIDIVHNINII